MAVVVESGEPEFQIAPMIDVLLVLLVFFMSITSAEVLKVDKNIRLPVSPNAKTARCRDGQARNGRQRPLRHQDQQGRARRSTTRITDNWQDVIPDPPGKR